tara:strand:- start:2302 stop:3060 length:759 start_codon:yes stop_codon:yes gene_type:complete
MKMVISPAKSLQFDSQLPSINFTTPNFSEEAKLINGLLKKKTSKALSELMHISDKLAQLNWERNQLFNSHESNNRRPAIFTFNGDVFHGLDANTLSLEKIHRMQNQLRILSGLYGLLRPLDLIQPYRLEMGTNFSLGTHKNLYDFWKDKTTQQLNLEMEEGELFVNLASNEYFNVIDIKKLVAKIVTPQFKDFKNGKLKIISFFAKKARGMMVRHLVDVNAKTIEDIKTFNSDGYSYSANETVDPSKPVFTR